MTGAYAESAAGAWAELVTRYRIEQARLVPFVTLVATDNWLSYTIRYPVDYRRRRVTKDQLFEAVLNAIDDTAGRVQLGSTTVELVGVPPVTVPHADSHARKG